MAHLLKLALKDHQPANQNWVYHRLGDQLHVPWTVSALSLSDSQNRELLKVALLPIALACRGLRNSLDDPDK